MLTAGKEDSHYSISVAIEDEDSYSEGTPPHAIEGEPTLESLRAKAKKLQKFLKTLQYLETSSENQKRFQCSDCSYRTTYGKKFVEHCRKHSPFHLFQCLFCPFSTDDEDIYHRHRSTHTKDKRFICPKCDYKTDVKGSLVQHLSIHERDKPFKCELCSYRTKRKWNLMQHISIHEERREKYPCQICSFKTNIKSRLKNHMREHSAEKKLKCPKCDYEVLRIGALHQHMLTHSSEKRFECSICGYKTNRKWSLKKHFLNTHSERVLSCPSCDFKPRTKDDLRQHRKEHRRLVSKTRQSSGGTTRTDDSINVSESVCSSTQQFEDLPSEEHFELSLRESEDSNFSICAETTFCSRRSSNYEIPQMEINISDVSESS